MDFQLTTPDAAPLHEVEENPYQAHTSATDANFHVQHRQYHVSLVNRPSPSKPQPLEKFKAGP